MDDDSFMDDDNASTITYMSVSSEQYVSATSSTTNLDTDRVYTVATDRTLKSVMSEYKKRKQQHTMPAFVKAARSRPKPRRKSRVHAGDAVENKIDEEQKLSITKVGIDWWLPASL